MMVREAILRYGAETPWSHPGSKVLSPRHSADFFRDTIAVAPVERIAVLGLNAKGIPVMWCVVGMGGAKQVAITAADIFRPLLLAPACTSFVLAHNHPSGDPTPSGSDVELTNRVAAAARLLGLDFLDHVVVTESGAYFSFCEAGFCEAGALV